MSHTPPTLPQDDPHRNRTLLLMALGILAIVLWIAPSGCDNDAAIVDSALEAQIIREIEEQDATLMNLRYPRPPLNSYERCKYRARRLSLDIIATCGNPPSSP